MLQQYALEFSITWKMFKLLLRSN